jgi:hypothetical protein
VARALLILLPDARERDTLITQGINMLLKAQKLHSSGFSLLVHSERWPAAWMLRTAQATDLQSILEELHVADWEYPALLTWREEGENRWNRSELGLRREPPLTSEGE